MATKTNILKNNLLNALEKHLGVVTSACKEVGCNRSTFYKYYNNDSKFKDKVDELQNVALDFVESKLFEQIQNDNATSTIFYLNPIPHHFVCLEYQSPPPFSVRIIDLLKLWPPIDRNVGYVSVREHVKKPFIRPPICKRKREVLKNGKMEN